MYISKSRLAFVIISTLFLFGVAIQMAATYGLPND